MADRYTSRSGNEGRLPAWADWAGGGSLGVLLGLLIGLSASPVVNTVISALVALLAGLFGFSEKISLAVSAGPARRLIAFSLCAALVVPAGVYVRTHDVLAPSLERQKADLALIGYQEGTPQHELIGFQRRIGRIETGVAFDLDTADDINNADQRDLANSGNVHAALGIQFPFIMWDTFWQARRDG